MSRILFLSHSHAFGPFRVGSHHYARHLALAGDEVIHLSTPVSTAHRLTGRIDQAALAAIPTGPYHDPDGVTHLVPHTLLPAPYPRFRADRALARHGLPATFDAILIDQPLLWHDSLRALTPRLIYRPTDLYPGGVKNTLQERILRAADGVIATSGEVLRGLGASAPRGIVIENGVDAERFSATERAERPQICVYVGALDARFDAAQIVTWARAYPDVTFVIAGPGTLPTPMPSNVDVRGAVSYDSLPALLRQARVGLLPLSDDPLNAGRSPMKLYEYLAAGLAVLTRETPVLGADEAAGIFTYRPGSSQELGRALAAPSPNLAGVARAATQAWDAKTCTLRSFALGDPAPLS